MLFLSSNIKIDVHATNTDYNLDLEKNVRLGYDIVIEKSVSEYLKSRTIKRSMKN